MTPLVDWLMQGPAWVQYRTRRDLHKQKENHPEVMTAHRAMLADVHVQEVIQQLEQWESTVISSHKSAGHPLHQPCPYANLVMLKTLALDSKWRKSKASLVAAETLLSLWAHSKTEHPYQFYMGTDFRKLKAPLVWYDLLHVFDLLTQIPILRRDKRLNEMATFIQNKADSDGRFTPESVWQAWSDWEFGQKKEPSRWVTLIAQRALKRMGI